MTSQNHIPGHSTTEETARSTLKKGETLKRIPIICHQINQKFLGDWEIRILDTGVAGGTGAGVFTTGLRGGA